MFFVPRFLPDGSRNQIRVQRLKDKVGNRSNASSEVEFTGAHGSGYVEESPLARLYRELPVNSIWEGSGNVMCLDLLRAFGKTPAARDALAAELELAAVESGGGGDGGSGGEGAGHGEGVGEGVGKGVDNFVPYTQALLADLEQPQGDEFGARRLAERVVLAVQAGLLLRHAPYYVSSAFVASRLAREPGGAFGRLPAGVDCAAILGRALVSA